jgi:cell wall-associated NlpC family hydrolase
VSEGEARARVCAIAASWIGTPFHDHGRVKGAGCDCATLLLCVFEEAQLIPPTDVGFYSPQFFQHSSEERYLGWVQKFGAEISLERARPGDVVVYKMAGALCFCHAAVVISPGWPTIIHAHAISRCVRRDNGRNPHLGRPVTAVKFFSLFSGRHA